MPSWGLSRRRHNHQQGGLPTPSTLQRRYSSRFGMPSVMCLLVGGSFSLDPCSPARRGPDATVKATLRYVAEDDGLAQTWRGKSIYMNSPYGRAISRWVEKPRVEVDAGHATTVIGLVPVRTDTRWWHEHVARFASVWLLKERMAFGDGRVPAPFPSALLLWGGSERLKSGIGIAFSDAWHVPRLR